ncbi:tetratricopeptide repeat protein [Bremerella sp.]|uniref:tetratricopeptide repeat protein n=1 Tax=Bremerella sp. TaxID=2795602 RepID=UPI0039194DCF
MTNDDRYARIDHYATLDLDSLLALEYESPRDADLLVAIGRSYFRLHQFDQSLAYYKRALKIDPNDGWTHLYLGNWCFALACYDEAVDHFEEAIRLLPGVACPHWCLAEVFEEQGYWTRTERHYRQAVETEPASDTARQKLEAWLAKESDRRCP